MRRKFRIGVFETNSSSSHTLCVCSKEDFEKWKDGKMLYDYWERELVSLLDGAISNTVLTYEEWKDTDVDTYEEECTTPGGENIIIFGKYGRM